MGGDITVYLPCNIIFLQKLASVCSTEKLLWYVSSWVLLQILMGILFNGICVDYERGQSVLTGFF